MSNVSDRQIDIKKKGELKVETASRLDTKLSVVFVKRNSYLK